MLHQRSDLSEPPDCRSWKLLNGCISTSIEKDTDRTTLLATEEQHNDREHRQPTFFCHQVICVHRCNFSSDASTLPAMHDHHGIRPNLKCLRSMHLALMSVKEEYLYCKVLHSIIVSLKYYWSPKLI
ncbi:hypothetical protein MXB_765, partial [Myxobolus squamalis]